MFLHRAPPKRHCFENLNAEFPFEHVHALEAFLPTRLRPGADAELFMSPT